jgi:hypothetical protein
MKFWWIQPPPASPFFKKRKRGREKFLVLIYKIGNLCVLSVSA